MQTIALVLPSLGNNHFPEGTCWKIYGTRTFYFGGKSGNRSRLLSDYRDNSTETTCNEEYTPYENSLEKTQTLNMQNQQSLRSDKIRFST